jgi:hypothetical protein
LAGGAPAETGACRGGEIVPSPRYVVAPATWITWTITTGVGRGDWDGAASIGMIGTSGGLDGGLAAAKLAALAAEIAPVSPAVATTPLTVQYTMRPKARSRSLGR